MLVTPGKKLTLRWLSSTRIGSSTGIKAISNETLPSISPRLNSAAKGLKINIADQDVENQVFGACVMNNIAEHLSLSATKMYI